MNAMHFTKGFLVFFLMINFLACQPSAQKPPEKPSAPPSAASSAVIKIDGSSTVFPITEAVSEEFQKSKGGAVKITVGISGTGGGFKKFCRGELDISDASRPILAQEMQVCKDAGIQYIELPVAYDALTVMVNPQNNWVTNMTVPDLKKIDRYVGYRPQFSFNQLLEVTIRDTCDRMGVACPIGIAAA